MYNVNRMRVLMLNPPYFPDFVRSARWAARSRGRVQRHPDYMLVAAAVLERSGHEILFLDGAARNTPREEVLRAALQFHPELAVVHTTTPSIYNDISYAEALKESCRTVTALVGNHVTAEPDDTLRIADGGADVVVRGEYDLTLAALADDPLNREVPGISFLDGGRPVHRPPAPPPDVNGLPFPAWGHVRPEWYRDGGKLFPFLTLLSGRGCFARCTFCQDPQVSVGHRLRMRDPRLVVDEMEYDLKTFPKIREIMVETDSFTSSPPHVRGVCEEVLRRGVKLTWSCNTRVDMDLSLLPLMKRAGCRMLMTGFEFGTQEALDAVKKGFRLERSAEFARGARDAGLTVHGCFMIGAPGETRESAMETIRFAASLPLDTIQISGICVYPGTEMYRWAKEAGFLVPRDWREWVSPTGEQVTLLDYPQLPKAEIDALIDVGLRRFYLRPRQILRMLAGVRSWGDIRRKAYGGMSFFRYFKEKRQKGGCV